MNSVVDFFVFFIGGGGVYSSAGRLARFPKMPGGVYSIRGLYSRQYGNFVAMETKNGQ